MSGLIIHVSLLTAWQLSLDANDFAFCQMLPVTLQIPSSSFCFTALWWRAPGPTALLSQCVSFSLIVVGRVSSAYVILGLDAAVDVLVACSPYSSLAHKRYENFFENGFPPGPEIGSPVSDTLLLAWLA
eukprot:1144555-Pelagomonas_calceolata.AAC.1